MNPDPEMERLLADVLAEDASPGFREELLVRTLRKARHHRHVRRWSRILAVATILVVAGVLLRPVRKPATIASVSPSEFGDLNVITSEALTPGMQIETRPGGVEVFSTRGFALNVISTSPGNGRFKELSDEQLLAMTSGRPSVLVRQGAHQAELLVIDAATGVPSVVESSRQ